jgi:hypothetical protein
MDNHRNEVKPAVGAQMKAEIFGAGLNIKTASNKTGINYRTLIRYIDGERNIPVPVVYQIADAVGLDARTIVERAEERLDLAQKGP